MATLAARVFGGLVRARDHAYASGRLGVARLPAPVISVGNLSTGGSGKTPTVIALGRALRARGWQLDVLSRGYRRAARGLAVAAAGPPDDLRAAVHACGDEPVLIAERLQAPVLVAADRFRAGLEGERRFASQLHLLDDGFQHRALARAFDLVLVLPGDLDDHLLPRGRLREPLTGLRRASALLWMEDWPDANAADTLARSAQERLAAFTAAPLFVARKRPLPPAATPLRPMAFCGLARPASFWHSLDQLGIVPAVRRAFPDHHRYRASDLRALRAAATAAEADGFLTTAKDAVKLPAGLDPLAVVEVEVEIHGLPRLCDLVLAACGGARS